MSPSADLGYQGLSLSVRNTFLHFGPVPAGGCAAGDDREPEEQPSVSRAKTAPLQGAAGGRKTASFMDTVEELYADDTTEGSEGREAPSRDETAPREDEAEEDDEEWVPPVQRCVTRDFFESPLAWNGAQLGFGDAALPAACRPRGVEAQLDGMWPASTLDGLSVQWDWQQQQQQQQLHSGSMLAPLMMVPAMFQGVAQVALSPADPMPAAAASFTEAVPCVPCEAWFARTETTTTTTACIGQTAWDDCRTEVQSHATNNLPSQSACSASVDAKPRSTGRQAQPQRTTVMLRNLPNNYTRDTLLQLIDSQGFAGRYDFLYFPIDFRTHAALGYAFLNLVTPGDAEEFHLCLNGFSQWSLPSSKVCSVGWSNPHQGLEAHIARYRNSPLMHESVPDSYRPVLFAEGLRVPFPPATKRVKPPRQGTERMLV